MFLLFIYHSFHFLCYYLKFSVFDFTYFFWLVFFRHAFSWLSLFGTTLVRNRFDSRVYICRIFLFFSFQVIQHLGYVFPGLLFAEIFSSLKILRVLTRILKVGVRDSLFVKSRSPSQKVWVPLPQNRSPIFFFFFFFFFFYDSPLILSMSPVTSFSFDSEHVPGNFIL